MINLRPSYLFTVIESLKFLHHVDVDSVANISDIYVASAISVDY